MIACVRTAEENPRPVQTEIPVLKPEVTKSAANGVLACGGTRRAGDLRRNPIEEGVVQLPEMRMVDLQLDTHPCFAGIYHPFAAELLQSLSGRGWSDTHAKGARSGLCQGIHQKNPHIDGTGTGVRMSNKVRDADRRGDDELHRVHYAAVVE